MKKYISPFLLLFFVNIIGFAQQRVVLIEQFTNSSCPPCASYSPLVYDHVNNNPTICCAVAYHTSFPYSNDSMYWDNTTESDQRVGYYAVSGVPYSIVDGNVYDGPSTVFTSGISSIVGNRAAVAPKYIIQSTNFILNGNQLSGSFKFTSADPSNSGENLVAHIVVIEKNVLKSAYLASPGSNSETSYEYVMRKMLPDADGTVLVNTANNGSDSTLINWTLHKIKDIDELRVVVFVQNNTTKEVYQAQLFNPDKIASIKEVSFANSFSVFPNPAKDEITISWGTNTNIRFIRLYNSLGQVVHSEVVNAGVPDIRLITDLPTGMYFIEAERSDFRFKAYEKIVINR
ncbi:MAG: T9SS type A sorting domain-containing protein [Bacteroidota bacterium]|nr:T9SS type A sorting domain-containing protein [Bacteroidota bacterium]